MTRTGSPMLLGLPLLFACAGAGAPDGAPEITTRGSIGMEAPADDEAELDLLELDGRTSLDFPPSTDFDLGGSGTIEFTVLADWTEDPGYFPCVLASRDRYGGDRPEDLAAVTNYSVHVTGDRQGIGLWNGETWAGVPFDFSDGEFHAVALVTEADRTTVFVDGEKRGELEIGYGAGIGLPFHVGSADGRSEFFVGAVSGVRIWRAALTAEALARVASIAGPPPADHPNAAALVAISSFSEDEPTLLLAGSAGGSP